MRRNASSRSYYTQIHGVQYARDLIERADCMLQSTAQLTMLHAVALWEHAQDGSGVTDCERRTLQHIADHRPLCDEARAFLHELTSVHEIGTRYYADVDGVQVDRTLWQRCELRARDGQISLQDARKLWVRAHDGPGVTLCEVRTMRLALARYAFTEGARRYMNERIARSLADRANESAIR